MKFSADRLTRGRGARIMTAQPVSVTLLGREDHHAEIQIAFVRVCCGCRAGRLYDRSHQGTGPGLLPRMWDRFRRPLRKTFLGSALTVKFLYLGIFGGLGCIARYALSGWVYTLAGRALPFGTLAVNVIGSLMLGLIMEGSLRSTLLSPDLRVGLTVGFLGGFTTFSTFSYETVRLLEEGSLVAAGANVLLNLTVCVAAAVLGIYLARQM